MAKFYVILTQDDVRHVRAGVLKLPRGLRRKLEVAMQLPRDRCHARPVVSRNGDLELTVQLSPDDLEIVEKAATFLHDQFVKASARLQDLELAGLLHERRHVVKPMPVDRVLRQLEPLGYVTLRFAAGDGVFDLGTARVPANRAFRFVLRLDRFEIGHVAYRQVTSKP